MAVAAAAEGLQAPAPAEALVVALLLAAAVVCLLAVAAVLTMAVEVLLLALAVLLLAVALVAPAMSAVAPRGRSAMREASHVGCSQWCPCCCRCQPCPAIASKNKRLCVSRVCVSLLSCCCAVSMKHVFQKPGVS